MHDEPGALRVPRAGEATPALVLLLAAWIGLVIGFLDLGLLIVRRQWVERGFYRVGGHFAWIIPAEVTAFVLVPAAALALVAWWRPGTISAKVAVGLLGFVGFLDLVAALPPVSGWAHFLLTVGLAVQSARLVTRHGAMLLRFVRRTAPLLGGLLLAIVLGTFGGKAWSEYRATAGLPPPPAGARNVLFLVWDTVRAQNLSLHGYARPTSPNLERLARQGVRFDRAYATAPWTLPSHASFFTGRWPHELSADWSKPLDAAEPTLAESLGERGYDTAGFVANLEYCTSETGLNRGFVHFDDYPLDPWDGFLRYTSLGRKFEFLYLDLACALDHWVNRYVTRSDRFNPRTKIHAKRGAEVDRAFLDWLGWQRKRGRPFFAFLNYIDAHPPYEVPDRSVPGFGLRPTSCGDRAIMTYWLTMDRTQLPGTYVRMAQDTYDDSIAYLDRRLGLLLQELRSRGVLDDTLVIVASDHGEHFGEHGLVGHGCSLYRELVEVPLVVVNQGRVPAGAVVTEPVSLRDLPATIVDLVGLARDAPLPGQSLARFWARPPAAALPAPEPLFMETSQPLFLQNQGREPVAKGPMKAVVAEGMQYIRTADGKEELYSLVPDPREQVNLARSAFFTEAITRFRQTLTSFLEKR